MTPAAIIALLSGNKANFEAASTPGGIEEQERQGQLEQAWQDTLPLEFNGCKQADFEALGFKFLGPDPDPLFQRVKFPAGWKKLPTDHSMWTEIVDDKGAVRARIFYKAAFYDRSAFVTLT